MGNLNLWIRSGALDKIQSLDIKYHRSSLGRAASYLLLHMPNPTYRDEPALYVGTTVGM